MADDLGPEPQLPVGLRVALVHDYLNQAGGAEKVVEVFASMFPDAPIFTSVYDAPRMPAFWRGRDIRTSFMQRISPRLEISKVLVPMYPLAFESFDLRGFDLVLSSTTTFAKGVITRPETCHVCYCNNPTRFAWMFHDYLEHERYPKIVTALLPAVASPLRVWDFAAAQRVDFFVAGSHNAARRIQKYYRRESDVLHSPIDCKQFRAAERPGNYFLIVSRLLPYKRIELAITACTCLGLPLHVVGDGSDRKRLQSMAGPTVTFLGWTSDEHVRSELSGCRALIFPGEEDFGLTPLEAQASGRPVIAYGRGGALETVIDGETGVLFSEQTVDSLTAAIRSFDDVFDPAMLRANALRFDVTEFRSTFTKLLARYLKQHRESLDRTAQEHVSGVR